MATFIKVSSSEEQLLRRNREEVQGNRLQKVETDQQATVGKDIAASTAQQNLLQQPGGNGRRGVRFKRDEPAATLITDFNLVVIELYWKDGKDYDMNIGRNNEFVGWFFSSRPDTAVNDGTLWNQLFWLRDNTSAGPASEYAVLDRSRVPTPGSNYPVGNFALEIFSYCYEELSTQPLTVSVYPVNVTRATGYEPERDLDDVQRLKALGLSRAQSFYVTVNRFNNQGEKGIKIGEIRFPGPKLLRANS